MGNKKGAFFFTLDTLLAGLVITMTVMMILSLHFSKPVVEDTFHELTNYVNFIMNTDMKDVRDNYYFAYDARGEEDLDLFINQKVFKLVQENNHTKANELLKNLSNFVFPQHLGLEYAVEDFKFSINNNTKDFAKTMISEKIFTYYLNESSVEKTITVIKVWS